MTDYLDEYNKLILKLNNEKELLNSLTLYSNNLYIKLKEDKYQTELLIKDNNNLNQEIKKRLNDKMNIYNIFLKLFSIFFIVTSVSLIGAITNLNFIILSLSCLIIPPITIIINYYIIKSLKKRYTSKNKNIITLNSLITENNIKINEHKVNEQKLITEIKQIKNKYNKQRKRINILENIKKRILNSSNTPTIEQNIKYKPIKKIKQKTRNN